jgi:peptide chain release factor 1
MLLRGCFGLTRVLRCPSRTFQPKVPLRAITTSSISWNQIPKADPDIDLSDTSIQNYLENIRLEFYGLQVSENIDKAGRKRMLMISHIVEMYEQRKIILANIKSLEEMKHENDEDMKQLMKEEREVSQVLCNHMLANVNDHMLCRFIPIFWRS